MPLPARPVLAAAAFTLALAAAPAMSAPAPIDDGQIPDLVSELVIKAVTPGPAWWKVSHDGAVVWILGTPPYLTTTLTWDKRPLARRLKGADRLIIPLALALQPFRIDANGRRIVETDGLAAPGQTVADLPPEMQARLHAIAKTFRLPTVSGAWSIIWATRQLNEALYVRASLSATAVDDQLLAVARTQNVRIAAVSLDDITSTPPYVSGPVEPKIACLESSMAVAELGSNPLRQGLEAWARGDLPSAMATVGCVGAKGRVYQQEAAIVAGMIEADLERPGKGRKTIAAVELIPLLMRSGVIEHLKADGYEIDAPDSAALATGE